VAAKLKRLSGRDVVRALRAFGFEVVNTRGSHAKLRRTTSDGVEQTLTIPLHDELATGTLHAIVRQVQKYVPGDAVRQHFFSDGSRRRS
jgi:predicted RNA binding protein YcfA (HicA-like mRNA interferase family)